MTANDGASHRAEAGRPTPRWRPRRLPVVKMAARARARAPGLPSLSLPPAGSATRVAVRRLPFGLGGGPGHRPPRAMWLLGWWQVLLWVLGPPARGLEGECGLGPWRGAAGGGAPSAGPPGRRRSFTCAKASDARLTSCWHLSTHCPNLLPRVVRAHGPRRWGWGRRGGELWV